MRVSVKKVILVALVACICGVSGLGFAQTADKLPQGLWKVEKIIKEKNTNGKIDTVVYSSDVNMNSVPLPQKWEIKDSQTIVWHYANGVKQPVEYTIENGQLMITTTTIQPYQYSISGEILTLKMIYSYTNYLHTGRAERIIENWTITLKK